MAVFHLSFHNALTEGDGVAAFVASIASIASIALIAFFAFFAMRRARRRAVRPREAPPHGSLRQGPLATLRRRRAPGRLAGWLLAAWLLAGWLPANWLPADWLPADWLPADLLAGPSAAAAETLEVAQVLLTVDEQVEAPALVEGPLAELRFREGDVVEAGAALGRVSHQNAELLRDRAQLALETARRKTDNDAPLEIARKTLALAESELKRVESATGRVLGAVSRAEVERLSTSRDRAELELQSLQSQRQTALFELRTFENDLQQAELALRQHTIPSPLEGLIVSVLKRPGEWVRPGEAVVRIQRLNVLRAEGNLSVEQAIQYGQLMGRSVRLIVSLNGEEVFADGRVRLVHSEVNSRSQQLRFWAEIDNRRKELRPGLTGRLLIDVE